MKLIRDPITRLLCVALMLMGAPMILAEEPVDFLVVVHESNPTEAVTRIELARIFLKKMRWKDGLRVQPVDQDVESPVRAAFTKAINWKSVTAIKSYWQRMLFSGKGIPPPEVNSDQAVLRYVRDNPQAVGYVSFEAQLEDGVRVLEIADPSDDD